MAMAQKLNATDLSSGKDLRIELLCGDAAQAALTDPDFIARWKQLHSIADSATVFQSPEYLGAWYACYAGQWEPILAIAPASDGNLRGLWTLARDRLSRKLINAGGHQAEYHLWLAQRADSAAFVETAWRALTAELGVRSLLFRYLPSADLLQRMNANEWLASRAYSRPHARPLLRLEEAEVAASMAKPRYKSRFNKLKKLGKFEFKRITDPVELDKIFQTLVDCYDLRQGAVNSSTPFREDPNKGAFHRALFDRGSPASYVTVTYLDGQPLAAFWGLLSGKSAILAMLIHTPEFSELSLGKLHLMQLSQQLLADGLNALDLTPGGDAWKETFANDHDQVAELTLFSNPAQARKAANADRQLAKAKQLLSKAGLTPDHLRRASAAIRKVSFGAVQRRISDWFRLNRELRIYRAERSLARGKQRSELIKCNAIGDLLGFEASEPWQSRDAFLSSALKRLERGERVFTICEQGRLIHSGWMVPRQTQSQMSEVGQTLEFPANSSVLYDFYTHPAFRGRGLYRLNIEHMLAEAFGDETTEFAYISVLSDNTASRRAIERADFGYQGSFFWQRSFGKDRKFPGPEFTKSGNDGSQT